ncbi:MAG: hypothetical protein EB140_08940, partial [Proteobacteria bacterium]|nr:hypothetical protein [Pseudomonadota bacterium]
MPLDARKVAHISANRTRIRAGRSETVVLIAAGNGTTGTQVVTDAVWHDRHDGGPVAVPYGGPTGTGHANRGSVAWDATVELPGSVSLPTCETHSSSPSAKAAPRPTRIERLTSRVRAVR